jgi:hypothetical protein
MVPGSTSPWLTQGVEAEAVHAALERVLTSQPFRTTAQCQKLLTYIVRHTLAAEDNLLRERMIGSRVFDRKPDYDASTDPVVRVRVAEVRKRLAQFYQSGEFVPGMVRIEIPAGSYCAVFHQTHTEPAAMLPPPPREVEQQTPPDKRKFLGRWSAIVAGVCAVALAAGLLNHKCNASAFDQFWTPALDSPKPVLIFDGRGVVYGFSEHVHDSHSSNLAPDESFADYALSFRKGEKIDAGDVVAITNQYVGIGDSFTTAQLCAMFARRDKLYQLRYGSDVSYGDLRYSPSVLIGAFNNGWTLQTTREFRFYFRQHSVSEAAGQKRVWKLLHLDADGHTPEDYAIVSRFFNSRTAQFLITAAGITQYGTRCAGEFLTTSSELENALRSLPAGWQKKNIQFVLHTHIVGEMTSAPEVVASYVW